MAVVPGVPGAAGNDQRTRSTVILGAYTGGTNVLESVRV